LDEFAIIISYPTMACRVIILLKTLPNIENNNKIKIKRPKIEQGIIAHNPG